MGGQSRTQRGKPTRRCWAQPPDTPGRGEDDPAAPPNQARRPRRHDPIQGWPVVAAVSERPPNPSFRGWLFWWVFPGCLFAAASWSYFCPWRVWCRGALLPGRSANPVRVGGGLGSSSQPLSPGLAFWRGFPRWSLRNI